MSPRSRRRGSGGGRNRRKGNKQPKQIGAGFWGDPAALPDPQQELRITDDAPAVARSLGPPPLVGHEIIAEAYFAAVYERAVTTAGALATAAGLLTPDELLDELDD